MRRPRRPRRRFRVAVEEVHHRGIGPGWRVRDVDHDLGARQRLGEAFARDGIHAGLGEAARTAWPAQRATTWEPTRPVPPITTIFMIFLRLGGRRSGWEGECLQGAVKPCGFIELLLNSSWSLSKDSISWRCGREGCRSAIFVRRLFARPGPAGAHPRIGAVAIGPQVFDLLIYLVENRERVISKDDLLEAVWGGRTV